jgi:hypothetical protein
MGIIIKDTTGREIFEAIKQNGFKVVREAWITGQGPDVSACLLGMAGLNLGVVASNTFDDSALGGKYGYDNFPSQYSLINQLNTVKMPKPNRFGTTNVGDHIITEFDTRYTLYLDEIDVSLAQDAFDDPTLFDGSFRTSGWDYTSDDLDEWARTISQRFNQLNLDPSQNPISNSTTLSWYKLSWDASVEMARQALEPYFDHVFKLATEDYSELLAWTPPVAA